MCEGFVNSGWIRRGSAARSDLYHHRWAYVRIPGAWGGNKWESGSLLTKEEKISGLSTDRLYECDNNNDINTGVPPTNWGKSALDGMGGRVCPALSEHGRKRFGREAREARVSGRAGVRGPKNVGLRIAGACH